MFLLGVLTIVRGGHFCDDVDLHENSPHPVKRAVHKHNECRQRDVLVLNLCIKSGY
jgi:hypothetical protein